MAPGSWVLENPGSWLESTLRRDGRIAFGFAITMVVKTGTQFSSFYRILGFAGSVRRKFLSSIETFVSLRPRRKTVCGAPTVGGI